jgi:hypothetical protein
VLVKILPQICAGAGHDGIGNPSFFNKKQAMWTLIEGFKHLNKEEIDALVEAPVLITILVGAADGEFDREERYWSNRLMQARTYARPRELNEFYRVVAEGFLDKVDRRMAGFPADTAQRNLEISALLANLNEILPRLEPNLASDLYRSFCALAEETAEASGGFLRIGAINADEAPWINLPMLTPVATPERKEEEEEEDEWV